jgi:archaellum biogenesis ATPase FlaH
MKHDHSPAYEFETDLPVGSLGAGTNLLVTGSSDSGAREVALRLVLAANEHDEGLLLVSSDRTGRALLDRCLSVDPTLDLSQVAIVDCAAVDTDEQRRFDSVDGLIAGPGDLSAISVHLSTLYEALYEPPQTAIRIGLFSLTSLLLAAPYREVSRFVHQLTGRIIATGDLGVYLLDTSVVDDEVVDSLETFCDGRMMVRRDETGETEYRTRGIDRQLQEWRLLQPGR